MLYHDGHLSFGGTMNSPKYHTKSCNGTNVSLRIILLCRQAHWIVRRWFWNQMKSCPKDRKMIFQIVMVSSTMELHSCSCKSQEHFEGKVEGIGSNICMKIYWNLLSKVSRKKKRELEFVPWRRCQNLESSTIAAGSLEGLMMKNLEVLYDKFLIHLTVMFARWIGKSVLGEPHRLYEMPCEPSQCCLTEEYGWTDILWRKGSSQRQGLSTRSPATDSLKPGLCSCLSLFLNPCSYIFCSASCVSVETFISSCLVYCHLPRQLLFCIQNSCHLLFKVGLLLVTAVPKKMIVVKTKTWSELLVMFCAFPQSTIRASCRFPRNT